jgi:hypothetical protein
LEVSEAIRTAKKYVLQVFADESILDVGLEEVSYDDSSNVWNVTVGFTRPWERARTRVPSALYLNPDAHDPRKRRTYKRVLISDRDGKPVAIQNRD